MSDFDPELPRLARIALLLPALRSRLWQEQIADELSRCDGVEVRIVRVNVAPRRDGSWRKLETSVACLQSVAVPVADPVDAAAQWHAVIDLAGIGDPAPWSERSRHGLWQVSDAFGVDVAAAYPCHASITSGDGGELFVLRDRKTALDCARFFADPHYPDALDRLYRTVAPLLRNVVQASIRDDLDSRAAGYAPRPRPTALRHGMHALRGRALAWRRRLKSQWLSESWMIGVIDAPIHEVGESCPQRIEWLGARESESYRADPFGVPGDPRRLYCEVYDHRDGVGRIERLALDEHNAVVAVEPVRWQANGHVSYPYVFEHERRVYAVPETAGQRGCDLYRIDGEGEWTHVAPLLQGVAAADASVFAWDGLFWLAYTDLALGAFDNLCLSYAEQLQGPWKPHPRHPIKLDHRSSRPAGTPFVHDGALYRPAQDCASGYGQAVAINRVEVCTPQDYREQVVRRIRPDPRGRNPHGLHTLSAWGERTLVDGKRYVFNLHELRRKLRERCESLRGTVTR
ncbi:MAG: glucosamine inositolphosphorylceramide transferase family protein [Lysobacter sp.]